VVSFAPWPIFPWGKYTQYALNRRLGGPLSQSGSSGKGMETGKPQEGDNKEDEEKQSNNSEYSPMKAKVVAIIKCSRCCSHLLCLCSL